MVRKEVKEMKRLLKVIANFMSVLTLMGVFSVANPVIAAEIQEIGRAHV